MNDASIIDGCTDSNLNPPLLDMLDSEEMKIINKSRFSVAFHKGEVILKQGTKANYFVTLLSGFAKMYIEGHNRRNLILKYVKPRTLVGGPGIHITVKHHFSVVAVQETLVCFIDLKNFRKILAVNSDFTNQYLALCSFNYGRILDRMIGLSQKQMHGRIADALIYLSEDIYESNKIDHEISRQDMADYTSMSKDSAIRILKEFERDSIIHLDGRTIEILDSKRLYDISQKG